MKKRKRKPTTTDKIAVALRELLKFLANRPVSEVAEWMDADPELTAAMEKLVQVLTKFNSDPGNPDFTES